MNSCVSDTSAFRHMTACFLKKCTIRVVDSGFNVRLIIFSSFFLLSLLVACCLLFPEIFILFYSIFPFDKLEGLFCLCDSYFSIGSNFLQKISHVTNSFMFASISLAQQCPCPKYRLYPCNPASLRLWRRHLS